MTVGYKIIFAFTLLGLCLEVSANQLAAPNKPANETLKQPLQEPTVDAVVQRAIDVVGGQKDIQSLRIEGVVSSPQGITHIQMLVQGAGPDKFRVTQKLPGGQSMESGTDGDLAWLRSPIDGSWRLLDRRGVLSASVGVLPYRMMVAIFERFPNRKLGPLEKKDGVLCRRIDMKDREGLEAAAWIEESSGKLRVLQTSETTSAFVPTIMTIEAWTKVGDLDIPRRISFRRGETLTTSDFTTISGDPIDAALFAPPTEVVLLSKGKDPLNESRTSTSLDAPKIKP
ncbi:MAG: hypothetical protein EXS12_08510 [Phycisphaerales bacterium]|nr:hypothetical protein [Phycisphaerales bacterium]